MLDQKLFAQLKLLQQYLDILHKIQKRYENNRYLSGKLIIYESI